MSGSSSIISYAKFRAKCDAVNILNKFAYEPITVFATSKIDPLPFQLEDFLSLLDHLEDGSLRVLISYETGLGKTILAGLLIKELLARKNDSRILIIAPPMVIPQWLSELSEKFSIRFTRFEYDSQLRDQLVVASINTIKLDDHFRYIKGNEFVWDMIVVDELHKATPGNKAYRLIEWLSSRTKHFIALSATPHNGLDDVFIARLRLIQPSVNENNFKEFLQRFNYRRRKDTVEDIDGKPLFPYPVYPERITVKLTPEEEIFYENFEKYIRDQYNLASKRKDSTIGLVASVLSKAASSSIVAGIACLERRCEKLYKNEKVLKVRVMDAIDEEEYEYSIDQLLGYYGEKALIDEEIKSINRLIELGESIKVDSKLTKLIEIIKTHIEKGNKVVVMTFFIATANYLFERLRESLGSGIYLAMGEIERSVREQNIKKFLESGKVLVGTDVIGESLNLQRANVLVNYELPWTPVPLIQRIGRVYRYPQTKPIFIHNFRSQLRIERRVLEVIYEKVENLLRNFDEGSVQVLGEEISEEEVKRIIEESYVKGEEEGRKKLEAHTKVALKHAEKLKEVLEISEAGKRTINAKMLLSDPRKLITKDDIQSFLESLRQTGLGEGNPYSEPISYTFQGHYVKNLSIEDNVIREALDYASRLPVEKVILVSDELPKGDGVVHNIEFTDSRGTVWKREVVASFSSGATIPYYELINADTKVSDSVTSIETIGIPHDLEIRLKERLNEENMKFKERIDIKMVRLKLESQKKEEGLRNPAYVQYMQTRFQEKIKELRRVRDEGLSVRPGEVLAFIRVISTQEHFKVTNDSRYDPEFLKHKKDVEIAAMEYVMKYEQSLGRQVKDVHDENKGYDIESIDRDMTLRRIEVKGISDPDEHSVTLSANEIKASNYFPNYYLYVVKEPKTNPQLIIKRPPFNILRVKYEPKYEVEI